MNENRLKDLKEMLESKFDDDIERMTPKDRLATYLSLMEFFVPKMNRSNFQVDENADQDINISYYGFTGNQEL